MNVFDIVLSRRVVKNDKTNYFNTKIGVAFEKSGKNGTYYEQVFDVVPTDWSNATIRMFPQTTEMKQPEPETADITF